MTSLFGSIESIALKVGSLTAGLLIANKTGIKNMILENSDGSDIGEVVRYGLYLSAVEWGTDMAASRVLGMRGISLQMDSGWNFVSTFGTNLAVYYVLEKTDLLDSMLDQFGDSDVNRAFANSCIYALVQELSYQVLFRFFSPTSQDYGQKFNF